MDIAYKKEQACKDRKAGECMDEYWASRKTEIDVKTQCRWVNRARRVYNMIEGGVVKVTEEMALAVINGYYDE